VRVYTHSHTIHVFVDDIQRERERGPTCPPYTNPSHTDTLNTYLWMTYTYMAYTYTQRERSSLTHTNAHTEKGDIAILHTHTHKNTHEHTHTHTHTQTHTHTHTNTHRGDLALLHTLAAAVIRRIETRPRLVWFSLVMTRPRHKFLKVRLSLAHTIESL